jgi:hypothetical protein
LALVRSWETAAVVLDGHLGSGKGRLMDDALIFMVRDACRRLGQVGIEFQPGDEMTLLEALREAMGAQHLKLVHESAPEGSPG